LGIEREVMIMGRRINWLVEVIETNVKWSFDNFTGLVLSFQKINPDLKLSKNFNSLLVELLTNKLRK
jgi:hypothetical protein